MGTPMMVEFGPTGAKIIVSDPDHSSEYNTALAERLADAVVNNSESETEHEKERLASNSIPHGTFHCQDCDKVFVHRRSLNTHRRKHTNDVFSCDICNSSFVSKYLIARHIYVKHTDYNPFVCGYCGRIFTCSSSLKSHIFGHTGLRPFHCPECGKKFTRNSHLTRHFKLHISPGDTGFDCPQCGKWFMENGNLKAHMRVHTGLKPFKCIECGKGFTTNNNLIIHGRIHSGIRPFTCSFCDSAFSDRSQLRKHIRRHTGERPHGCEVCFKRFSSRSNLRSHMLIHTGGERAECKICGKIYNQKNSLNKHVRKKHADFSCIEISERVTVTSNAVESLS